MPDIPDKGCPMTWDEVDNWMTREKGARFTDIPEVETVEVEDEIL